MTLPKGFIFNQSNLQDYVDCQRRFQLRYLLHQAWPAIEAEPIQNYERVMDRGSRFHKLVRQHLTGIPVSLIEQSFYDDEDLQVWWSNYKHSLEDGILNLINLTGNRLFEELTLSTPVDEFRLVAKYDLLVVQPEGKWLIFDWKTTQKHPKKTWLANRLQTHVYPFVLTHAAISMTGGIPLDPGYIEMVYWFANQPDQPERFVYNRSAYLADTKYLGNLISAINQKSEPVFPLTQDQKRCLFCVYRSLCNRGVKPGEFHQLEEWQETGVSAEDVSIKYDQIVEIEF